MHYNYTVHNTYDIPFANQSYRDQWLNAAWGPGNYHDRLVACNARNIDTVCQNANAFCDDEVDTIFNKATGRNIYDIRELNPSPFPYNTYQDYLNSPRVSKALGAYTNWTMGSMTVSLAFETTMDEQKELNTIEDVRCLVEEGVYVIVYHGDADYICDWRGGEVIAEQILAPGFDNAGYQNISTSDAPRVHGQVKQAGNFAFARIYESGHEVPFYQPLLAYELFERAIKRVDVAEGKTNVSREYMSKGTRRSEFHNGNSTVQFATLPGNATYNTTTNAPNAPGKVRWCDG
ncbi:hypothetical protein PRZ48_013745 [Zasmidium cellare]|uniref:Serine carboxypeptidase n=1 Tax=Zasmidium cellare TaxID=395010 RepID=A0ABR0E1W5_ZASCE|nr:hypothetical protein PRZ48_013745 [Zasmidium cellare]